VFDKDGKWQGDKLEIGDGGEKISCEFPIMNTNHIPNGYVTVPVKIDDN
jgi:hypothetical protein